MQVRREESLAVVRTKEGIAAALFLTLIIRQVLVAVWFS